jgi:fructokinase
VSNDVFGDELMQKSAEAGLDLRFIRQVNRPPLLAMVESKQPPQYFFIGEHSADLAFDPSELPTGALDAAEIVHFGSLGLVREPLASRLIEVAQTVRAAGKRISFDPNFRAPMAEPAYRTTLWRMAGLASHIKVSDEDLRGLFPDLDEAAALAQLREWAPGAGVLVTRGASGMTLFEGDNDASVGGWMASLLTHPEAPAAEHLRYAAACAAVVCGNPGAYAPTAAEVASLLDPASPSTHLTR